MSEWNKKTAEWYAEKYGEYETNRLGIEALDIPTNSTIVDVGCGTGCALRHAALKAENGVFFGVDPVPRMIEIAQGNTSGSSVKDRIRYLLGSAENIPVADSFADIVLAFDSYDHWKDKAKGLKEVHRVLKATGRFVIVKDGGLPNGKKAVNDFLSALKSEGFKVIEQRNVERDGVSFTQWECVIQT